MYNRRMRSHFLLIFLLFILTACGQKDRPELPNQSGRRCDISVYPNAHSRPHPHTLPIAYCVQLTEDYFANINSAWVIQLTWHSSMSARSKMRARPAHIHREYSLSYNANLFIQMMWQISPGAADPQFMLDLILDDGIDTPVGTPEVKLIRDMNVVYTAITTTASPVLPYGGSAAWTCGERVFAWKVYTPDEVSASGLFESALARFTCNR